MYNFIRKSEQNLYGKHRSDMLTLQACLLKRDLDPGL